MSEARYGEYITDQSSAEAWLADTTERAGELSARAQGIDLGSVLWPKDLKRLRQEAAEVAKDPEDFLRTRAQLFSELGEDDEQRQLGLTGYIEQDIDQLLEGPVAS